MTKSTLEGAIVPTEAPRDPQGHRVVFSNPELRAIEQGYQDVFGPALADDDAMKCAAAFVEDHVQLVVEIGNYDRTRVVRLESVSKLESQALEQFLELRADLVEFMAQMLEEYLATQRLRGLHADWAPYEYKGRDVRFRTTYANEAVERMADEWLSRHEEGEG